MTNEITKKQKIVLSSFEVLMRDGIQGLSFDRVAEVAGFSRQLVRYYFKGTEELMIALCDHLAGTYREALIGGVSELAPRNRIDFFLDFYFDVLDGHRKPRDDQAYDALFAYAAGSEPVKANLRAQYGLLGHVVSHEIKARYPDLDHSDCAELSYLFVCLMYGHWKMVATLGFCEEHSAITRQALDRLMASYDQNPGPRAEQVKVRSAQK